jgi:RNA ligase (TIGR02306 family)
MMRKLASVVRVDDLRPIPKADAIKLTAIAGWQCVVKKGEFVIGDRAVYIEIDAVPPDTPTFSWLWQPQTPEPEPVPRPASFCIRTMRLRGGLSQGLLLPLATVGLDDDDVAVGDDVTVRPGVTKYEPDVPLGAGGVRGPFPGVVPKIDEMRVQGE